MCGFVRGCIEVLSVINVSSGRNRPHSESSSEHIYASI